GSVSSRRYWRLPVHSVFEGDTDRVARRIEELLTEAVRSHLASDVPLAILMSGGLDSSLIAAIASRLVGDKLKSFTFGYSGQMDEADSIQARIVSEFLGTDHKEVVVDESRLLKLLPRIVYHHDAPQVDEASVPTLASAEAVRRYATVVLVGEGSDEQFGGYVSNVYFRSLRRLRAFSPQILALPRVVMLAKQVPLLQRYARILELSGSL